jgi:hypothetical protein
MKRPNFCAKNALLEMHATLAGEMQTSNEQYFKLIRKIRKSNRSSRWWTPRRTCGRGA